MSEHLSPATVSALADGELTGTELMTAQAHLASCQACTSAALSQVLLKTAVTRSGQKHVMPAGFEERMQRLVQQQSRTETKSRSSAARRSAWSTGWAVAAVLLLTLTGVMVTRRGQQATEMASVVEARDLHVAALAAATPEVISTDRHTVKPWFQGKLPFSFNLPEGLPEDVKLEGGNLVYLHGQPVAQLLYSVGKHRASVFLQQRGGDSGSGKKRFEGFNVDALQAGTLEITAVSDVEAAKLTDLAERIQRVQ